MPNPGHEHQAGDIPDEMMPDTRPLSQRMLFDSLDHGEVEKWAKAVAELEARIEALERERVEAEKKIAVAKAFVDDGVLISFEELGPTCACCREDYESRREPPYDEGNPNQPYKQVDPTKHTADCVLGCARHRPRHEGEEMKEMPSTLRIEM